MATPAETAMAVVTPTPADLLQIAVTQNADVDKLEKLMLLQERWEKNEARKAFIEALNNFKADPPKLEKVKAVDFSSKGGNRVNYNYAPLDYVAKVLGAALSKHGLSFRWSVAQADVNITVTCILQHAGGHSESVALSAGLHTDERMNQIQRLGSTVTYLERYTLLAATGMATETQDSDGMTNGELAEQLEWIENSTNNQELDNIFKNAFNEAKKKRASKAMLTLVEARDKRKQELAR